VNHTIRTFRKVHVALFFVLEWGHFALSGHDPMSLGLTWCLHVQQRMCYQVRCVTCYICCGMCYQVRSVACYISREPMLPSRPFCACR